MGTTLHRISPAYGATPRADVVFVHGLGGDAFGTWRHGSDASTSWPHWLAEDVPEVCVWSLGYPAAPTTLTGVKRLFSRRHRDAGHTMPLPERAQNVLDRLAQEGIGTRPLVFVCHSLGGLVVKHVLRKADQARNETRRALLANTRGVLFLATPHAGSELATLLDAFREIFGATVTIEELRAHDVHLHDIYDWYQTKAPEHDIRTMAYYESRAVHGVARIVHRASANPGVGDNPVALDEDHLSIAKPRDRGAQVCAAARELVVLALPTLPEEEGRTPMQRHRKSAAARLGTIFISYASPDAAFVDRLDQQLTDAGYETWRDRKDLMPGDPLASTIAKGIDEASVQIVVMSETSVRSDWVSFEVNHAVTRMNNGLLLKVIPALISGSELQSEVSGLLYADYRPSFDHGMHALERGLEQLVDDALIGGIRSLLLFEHIGELTDGQVDWGTHVTLYTVTTLTHPDDDGEAVVLHEVRGDTSAPIGQEDLVDFENLAERAPEHRFLVLSERPFAFTIPEDGTRLHERAIGLVTDSPWGDRRSAFAAVDASGDADDRTLRGALGAAAAWLTSHPENTSPQKDVFVSPPVPNLPDQEDPMDGPVDFWSLQAAQPLCDRLTAAYGANIERVRRLVASSGTPSGRIAFQGVPPMEVWSATVEAAYNGETLCALLQQVLDDGTVRAHHDAVRSLGRELGCEL